MIGRKEEQQYLQSLLYEGEPQFVAVFGRRRIGKTYLVRESFGYHFTFTHTGVSNNSIPGNKRKQTQLERFAESLKEAGYNTSHLSTWNEAFDGLKKVIENSNEDKKVVFIDELSWMDTKGSGLISALESFWNGWASARKQKDIVLIVCASATYWMIDNIVNAKGGLHNRLTGKIHLKPFSLRECEEYLRLKGIILNRHQIIQSYMIMGGVPYYWSFLKKGKSLAQNIDDIFFKEEAPLKNEYNNLYASLFNKPDQYMKIMEVICDVGKGVSQEDISRRSGIPRSGEFSKKLVELENCGFIRRYIPYGYKQKNGLYQAIDNYTIFYYKFLMDDMHEEDYWKTMLNSPKVNAWTGIAFEKVCLEHIPQIKKSLGIYGVRTQVNAWHCKKDIDKGIYGSQIDLLIVRDDHVINVCEMKYSNLEYVVDASFDRSIKRKISDFKSVTGTKSAIHATLITVYEPEESSYLGDIQAIVTADALFE